MSKFKVGGKVLVTGNSYYSDGTNRASEIIGEVCEIKTCGNHNSSVWNVDKTDWWYVRNSDLKTISETPKEITLNGATYVLKEEPKPEHEWKFGDIAVHEEFGVGIVFGVDGNNSVCFKEKTTLRMVWRNTSELTFLRRADLSV